MTSSGRPWDCWGCPISPSSRPGHVLREVLDAAGAKLGEIGCQEGGPKPRIAAAERAIAAARWPATAGDQPPASRRRSASGLAPQARRTTREKW